VFHNLEKQIQATFQDRLRAQFNVGAEIVIEQPRQASFGEIALPIAFQLAKTLKQPPKKIAGDLVASVGPIPGVAAMEIAGNGYINIRFDRALYADSLLRGQPGSRTDSGNDSGKTIVEHTNINPNKAAHIGHLRNAVLGDTFVRMLRSRAGMVEVQNYIDNTGVQVADVVAGFHFLENKTPADVAALMVVPESGEDSGKLSFDYLCWDLYARTSQHYKDHPETLAWRADTLHAIEAGDGELAELAHLVADAIVNAHLATMLRLNIQYDVLPRESEILHLKFWASAFDLLRERKAIYFEEEGRNKGCWVMPSSAFRGEGDENEDSKVIVRSNGTVTYVGKDIAYQLWKFGLLGKDFYYRPLARYTDGHQVWVSTDEPQPHQAPPFGRAQTVYNVIDTRQSYLQDVVVAGLRALGFEEQAERSVHFSYEMVALSPRCCAEMGIELSPEDARRPYVEVSGRKGLGVKADDLMDKLVENALGEVASRHPEDSPVAQRAVATEIAMGALRYFLLKFTRNTVIAFDFQEALSFEGETGPYVQYATVRARNILRKLEERGETLPDFAAELNSEAMGRQLTSDDSWQILLAASRADAAVEKAVSAGEPAHVARYAFQLAQSFNNFYHQYPILSEPDRERKVFLLWMTGFFAEQLERTLAILGIAVPAYM
jgi:arginyl-tRNA synthetase